MRIAALVKQVPAFDELELGPNGRLRREGLDLEMNPYCRRAVSQAVELAAAAGDGTVTVFTLGPPSAEQVLREAIAWGEAAGVSIDGVLITDRAFAGSDTWATARALSAALHREGPFDCILAGRNSVDADTGQVPPQIAELLDLPFATGVRHLSLQGDQFHLRCEHDDGWVQMRLAMPAVLSTAERLIEPCKMDAEARALVDPQRIQVLTAAELADGPFGAGPWGAAGSLTSVGPVRFHEVTRDRVVLSGPLPGQVDEGIEILQHRHALPETLGYAIGSAAAPVAVAAVPPARAVGGPVVAVISEPDRAHDDRELLGTAAQLATTIDGQVVHLTTTTAADAGRLGSWGADVVVELHSADDLAPHQVVEEDVAAAVARWAKGAKPWAVLVPSTAWGREVAARVAVHLEAGLTGDAIALEVDDGRLVAWKPAFGGQLVAAILATSPVQMATVRAGVLGMLTPRVSSATIETLRVEQRDRVHIASRTRDDDLDSLAEAEAVVGIGSCVTADAVRRARRPARSHP